MNSKFHLLFVWVLLGLLSPGLTPALGQTPSAQVWLLNAKGQPLDHLTDGDEIRLRVQLTNAVDQPMQVSFSLADSDVALGECIIPLAQASCDSPPVTTLGWRWDADGVAVEQRAVQASTNGTLLADSAVVRVAPRPVVMVHGFSSSWQAWERYLGPQGYLARIGLPGFAVGNGQVEGTMNTGRLEQPDGRTNTIAENAAILARYVAGVKALTGAQRVDLLAHSMGGLISRYYIDRLMNGNEVAQLIMLGSPMAGTACANLPAALGFYLPAALEIRPNYVTGVFNQQITHRHGVTFHALAGIPILEALKSPCTPIPSDLAVSQESVDAIPLHVTEMSILHTELNTSSQVFEGYVRPLLQTTPGNFTPEPDPLPAAHVSLQQQFTRTYAGHLAPGESQELTIAIDPGVAVASFALFDPSRSLQVSVRGASGRVIELDTVQNGLTVVDDPRALFHLGYGFNNPRPGVWRVTLQTTRQTPTAGADYALSASFQGGARLQAQVSQLLPEINQPVQFSATFDSQDIRVEQAQVSLRAPDGSQETLSLTAADGVYQAVWRPSRSGLYSIEISLSGRTATGNPLERAAYFTLEARAAPRSMGIIYGLSCATILFVLVLTLKVLRPRPGRGTKQSKVE